MADNSACNFSSVNVASVALRSLSSNSARNTLRWASICIRCSSDAVFSISAIRASRICRSDSTAKRTPSVASCFWSRINLSSSFWLPLPDAIKALSVSIALAVESSRACSSCCRSALILRIDSTVISPSADCCASTAAISAFISSILEFEESACILRSCVAAFSRSSTNNFSLVATDCNVAAASSLLINPWSISC